MAVSVFATTLSHPTSVIPALSRNSAEARLRGETSLFSGRIWAGHWQGSEGREGGVSAPQRERGGAPDCVQTVQVPPAPSAWLQKLPLSAAIAYANDLQLHQFNLPFESA
jgi:hypothetical protein